MPLPSTRPLRKGDVVTIGAGSPQEVIEIHPLNPDVFVLADFSTHGTKEITRVVLKMTEDEMKFHQDNPMNCSPSRKETLDKKLAEGRAKLERGELRRTAKGKSRTLWERL